MDVSHLLVDVGWNPRWLIFHEMEGSHDEHEEHERGTRGETRENHSSQQEQVTHMLDPRNTKRYKIHDQQGTIERVTGSSP